MKLSIIVPVYNSDIYLKRCINSLIYSYDFSYEIILVDDGSTDNSPIICDDFSSKYTNVVTYHKNNEGLGYTRNYGINKAKGKYLLFVDSDDCINSNNVNKLINYMDRNEYDVLFFGMIRVTDGKVIEEPNTYPDIIPNYKELASLCLGEPLKSDKYKIGSACKALYKKRFINNNNIRFKSERDLLSEDYIFSTELCLANPKVGFFKDIIYVYNKNSSSLTTSYQTDRANKAVILFKEMENIIINNELDLNSLERSYNNFLINILVSIKQIVLNDSIDITEKKNELSKICNNENIIIILNRKIRIDDIKLIFLKYFVVRKKVLLLFAIFRIRYYKNKRI